MFQFRQIMVFTTLFVPFMLHESFSLLITIIMYINDSFFSLPSFAVSFRGTKLPYEAAKTDEGVHEI
jgi:hypothetical protein